MLDFANPSVTLLLAQQAVGWFFKCAGLILTPLMPKGVLPVSLGPGRMTPPAVPYKKQPAEKRRAYHGLLVLIGLDAADKKGLAHAESPHQQLQGALELAAERRRALPRLCSLQNRSAVHSGNERITLPFPSGCVPRNLLQQQGLEQGARPEVAESCGKRGEGQSL